ncbi:MAG TPA: (2Fe-2S)-binding protein [Terriglobales bacterium]|nr:(2Fe-2S)-binding protein [Terriglobales bacterium]
MKREEESKATDPSSASSGVSRRDFLKISGISVAVPMVVGPTLVKVEGAEVPVYGPGTTPVSLMVNGKKFTAELEPRVTLLDALRNNFDLTGAKKVCDRAECGACTVLMNGKAVYACAVLAIDAQGQRIETVESLARGDNLHAVQRAFMENDAQQCGFCTPGFVMASKALLDKNPHPTPEQVQKGLSGNYCRCGTYAGIRRAMADLAHGKEA